MSLKFEVKVVPSSGKLKSILDKSGKLKVYLKAQPERGKANEELVKYLAKACKITQSQISIVAGSQSRNKIVVIDAKISYEQLLDFCGIVQQKTLF